MVTNLRPAARKARPTPGTARTANWQKNCYQNEDMSDDDDSENPHPEGASQRESPYPVSRLSAKFSLVDAAREIERADQWIASTATAQLTAIAAQMQHLREQAEAVVAKAREDAELHRAEARFNRVPGKVYHLYMRPDATRYWSMLSPQEWNGRPPHSYVGSYRLEPDHSWTASERLAERDQARAGLADWMKTKLLP
jgi:hypothetical protein